MGYHVDEPTGKIIKTKTDFICTTCADDSSTIYKIELKAGEQSVGIVYRCDKCLTEYWWSGKDES